MTMQRLYSRPGRRRPKPGTAKAESNVPLLQPSVIRAFERALAPLSNEHDVVSRLAGYRSRNQHRSAKWRSATTLALRTGHRAIYESRGWLRQLVETRRQEGKDCDARWTLLRAKRVLAILDKLIAASMDACVFLQQQISSRAFLALALSLYASFSRVHALAQSLRTRAIALLPRLAAALPSQTLSAAKRTWPALGQLLPATLPPLQVAIEGDDDAATPVAGTSGSVTPVDAKGKGKARAETKPEPNEGKASSRNALALSRDGSASQQGSRSASERMEDDEEGAWSVAPSRATKRAEPPPSANASDAKATPGRSRETQDSLPSAKKRKPSLSDADTGKVAKKSKTSSAMTSGGTKTSSHSSGKSSSESKLKKKLKRARDDEIDAIFG